MKDLIVKDNGIITKIEQFGMDGFVKQPLQNEIFLSEIFVEGVTFEPAPAFYMLSEGDEVALKRKKKDYDEFYVEVLTSDNKFVGELDDAYNEIIARLMDAGKKITAKVRYLLRTEEYNVMSLDVFLKEF
ncbi:MAG: HIRAN domain-containing protein [bacterium]|nr:HIRAN domain-containing protein [bacterium]